LIQQIKKKELSTAIKTSIVENEGFHSESTFISVIHVPLFARIRVS